DPAARRPAGSGAPGACRRRSRRPAGAVRPARAVAPADRRGRRRRLARLRCRDGQAVLHHPPRRRPPVRPGLRPLRQPLHPRRAPAVRGLRAGAGGGAGGPPAPYVQPAPWRQLTAADVEGVWLGFGVGMDKQYFIIRRDGDRLFGLACGRCDNPYTHGALENFRIEGDTLAFDIVHQDWGDGTVLPFSRHVVARIAMNEMRMDARRPDQTGPGIVASLVGPIAIEATRGNVTGE